MTGEALDFSIGILELAIAAYVAWRFWRFRGGFPWLIAPAGFFVLLGTHRIKAGIYGPAPTLFGLLLDPLILVGLLLLLVAVDRIVGGLAAAENAAEQREQEYARALLDYRRLARHRLATPVTVILAGARYLLELGQEERKVRAEVVGMIEEAATRLENVSLDPRGDLEASERSLRPTPSLDRGAVQRSSSG